MSSRNKCLTSSSIWLSSSNIWLSSSNSWSSWNISRTCCVCVGLISSCSRNCCCSVCLIWSSWNSCGSGINLASCISGSSSCSITSLYIFSTLASNIFFSLWIVNNLSFDWKILNSLPSSFYWLIFNNGFLDLLWNVLDLSLNSIIISDGSLDWNSFVVDYLLILDNFSFKRNSFNSLDSVILNIFFLERNILYSAFNWYFFSNNSLSWSNSDSWSCISTSGVSTCSITTCVITACSISSIISGTISRRPSDVCLGCCWCYVCSCCGSTNIGGCGCGWTSNVACLTTIVSVRCASCIALGACCVSLISDIASCNRVWNIFSSCGVLSNTTVWSHDTRVWSCHQLRFEY